MGAGYSSPGPGEGVGQRLPSQPGDVAQPGGVGHLPLQRHHDVEAVRPGLHEPGGGEGAGRHGPGVPGDPGLARGAGEASTTAARLWRHHSMTSWGRLAPALLHPGQVVGVDAPGGLHLGLELRVARPRARAALSSVAARWLMVSCTDQPSAGVARFQSRSGARCSIWSSACCSATRSARISRMGARLLAGQGAGQGRQGVEVVDQGAQAAQAAAIEVEQQAGQVGLVAVLGFGGGGGYGVDRPRSPRCRRRGR